MKSLADGTRSAATPAAEKNDRARTRAMAQAIRSRLRYKDSHNDSVMMATRCQPQLTKLYGSGNHGLPIGIAWDCPGAAGGNENENENQSRGGLNHGSPIGIQGIPGGGGENENENQSQGEAGENENENQSHQGQGLLRMRISIILNAV